MNELDWKAVLDRAVAHCRSWEAETNARVARLYGLTPEEIQLVEEATKNESAFSESQRDSVPKPRVARDEPPWVTVVRRSQPQRGCFLMRPPNRHNPVGVMSVWPETARTGSPSSS